MNNDRIRVLFAVFADETNFNAQTRNAQEIALRLDRKRFLSTFFYAQKPDQRLRDSDHIRLLETPRRLGSLKVASELVWGPYDILFYVTPGRAARFYWLLHRLGRSKKVLATVEGSAAQVEALPKSQRRQFLAGLRKATAAYAITDYIRDSMQETFGVSLNPQAIPVGVDLSLFEPVDRTGHVPPWKILFVGSIQPRKKLHLILELAGRLPALEFHLVGDHLGDPSYLLKLKERKRRERLENVHFHGLQPPERIADRMQEADVFLLPSRLEGLPKVTLEAAATGLPCIVFDDYRTPSVRDEVNGFQVHHFEEMLDCLRRLAADQELRLRMGEAGVKLARPFSWDVVAGQWQEALLEVHRGCSDRLRSSGGGAPP